MILVYTAGSFGRDDAVREDELRVFADSNRDGVWQDGEPFADLAALGFVREASLVALGDSFSAGENGEFRAGGGFGPGSDGGYYLTGNPAAFDCRRWDRAYARLLPSLESSVYGDVETYACTGAITLNIFHPEDRDYDGLHDTLGPPSRPPVRPPSGAAVRETIETNRPSPAAEPYLWPPPADGQDEDWEPRQGRSLRDANTQQTVDMVTLTIGGNDLGFAEVLTSCYVGGCAAYLQSQELTDRLSAFDETLAQVFAEVKSAAPDAAIFVLGYPYLVPYSLRDYQDYLEARRRDLQGGVSNPGSEFLLDERERCFALRVHPLLEAAGVPITDLDAAISLINSFSELPDSSADFFGAGVFVGDSSPGAATYTADTLLKIDTIEKWSLKGAAERLNGVIESRAREVGVHFVDVLEAFPGHDPCGADPWLNGLVVDEQSSALLPRSGRSFHPNAAGHEQYAAVLSGSLAVVAAPTAGTAQVAMSATDDPVVRYVAGDGVDSFSYEVCDTLGACATAQVTVTVGTSHCTIVGTDGDDTLVGTPGADVICGLGGDDTISGLDGDDTLYGGDETRIGVGDGDDTLFGGDGDDTLAGGNGGDVLWGGAGADTLEGNRREDTLVGGPGADTLNGGGENDTLWGGSGGDSLIGHAGDDTLHGGSGADTLVGGNGGDVLWGGAGADILTGGADDDTLWGGPGDDTLEGNSQNDTLWGGAGADTLRGGGHDDRLIGGPDGDTLRGNAGDDRLWGLGGVDTLDGGNGGDYIDGGDGTDTCTRGETTARCEQ